MGNAVKTGLGTHRTDSETGFGIFLQRGAR